jgi:hypothetical protein
VARVHPEHVHVRQPGVLEQFQLIEQGRRPRRQDPGSFIAYMYLFEMSNALGPLNVSARFCTACCCAIDPNGFGSQWGSNSHRPAPCHQLQGPAALPGSATPFLSVDNTAAKLAVYAARARANGVGRDSEEAASS